jgi:hypothetical protein
MISRHTTAHALLLTWDKHASSKDVISRPILVLMVERVCITPTRRAWITASVWRPGPETGVNVSQVISIVLVVATRVISDWHKRLTVDVTHRSTNSTGGWVTPGYSITLFYARVVHALSAITPNRSIPYTTGEARFITFCYFHLSIQTYNTLIYSLKNKGS